LSMPQQNRSLHYASLRSATVGMTGSGLAKDALQLHGDAHVAFDLELAGHESGHAVELAGDHVGEVAEVHAQGAVGGLVVIGNGRRILVAVDEDDTLVGGELDGVAKGG